MSARRVLEAISILMLLVAPLRMAIGGPATAGLHGVEATMDLGHCDGGDKPEKGPIRPHSHCSMAAPGLPAVGEPPVAVLAVAAIDQPLASELDLTGLDPEATTPPPRLA